LTYTPSPTATATATVTPSPAPTATFTHTPTPTSTPTFTLTPTSTLTPTNTSTPTATPTSTPFIFTGIFQITEFADAVNEDGPNLTESSFDLWIGAGESEESYTGLRFENVSVPPGATIVSAQLEFYSPDIQWIGLEFEIAAESADSSASFSVESRPSSRVLTATRVRYESDFRWEANTWYSLHEDLRDIIREVISRPGWQSGNSLSIIIHNMARPFSRKTVIGLESAVEFLPRLVIRYQQP
jgi:hypothetical protein